jgi:hypothetical protein
MQSHLLASWSYIAEFELRLARTSAIELSFLWGFSLGQTIQNIDIIRCIGMEAVLTDLESRNVLRVIMR